MLFELLCLFTGGGPERLHVRLESLKLSFDIFILGQLCLAVNGRYPSLVFTTFKILISV